MKKSLLLLLVIVALLPTGVLAYHGLSTWEIIGTFTLPLAIMLFAIGRILSEMEEETKKLKKRLEELRQERDNLQKKVERLRNALFQLEHIQRSHSLLRSFLDEISNISVPDEILPKTYEYLKMHAPGIRGLSVYLKGKGGSEATLIFREGDTSPPKLRLEPEGTVGQFIVHLGFDPSQMHANIMDDTTKVIQAALKRWEEMMGSLTDPLTGAYTRKFLDMLKPYLEDPMSEYCLMMIDLDNFKQINDTKGHKEGDMVLKETARRISNSLRADDILIRYGGDEFLVLLKDSNLRTGIRVGERIRAAVRNGPITASVGVAYKRKGIFVPMEKAIKLADALMYLAKKEKDKVVGGPMT